MKTRKQVRAWKRTRIAVLRDRAMVIHKPPKGVEYRVTVEERNR
jgi:hypothetical protein